MRGTPHERLTTALAALAEHGPTVDSDAADAARAHYGQAGPERGNTDNGSLSGDDTRGAR